MLYVNENRKITIKQANRQFYKTESNTESCSRNKSRFKVTTAKIQIVIEFIKA